MSKKAWVITVNMGYGHQRTAFPLRKLAYNNNIINANDYPGIPLSDKRIWEATRNFYESISRFSGIPLIGGLVFSIYDQFQKILSFYPKRDLSRPGLLLKKGYSLFEKGWGKHLIEELKSKNKEIGFNLPIISTFFTPAFMAEFFGYEGDIFCVVCDADISRSWVPVNPRKSKIKYLAPTERVVERLRLYGVNNDNIFFTGYPLPEELIGFQTDALKENLRYRLLNLDPQKRYIQKYSFFIEKILGKLPHSSNHILTLMFSIGGAGAHKEIAEKMLRGLRLPIIQNKIKIILSAGIKENVKNYFEEKLKELKIKRENIEIIFEREIKDYFEKFNSALEKTDILWTKPSELSFYSALGMPIIIAPPIGSQEDFNMRWLLKSGFGIFQENPFYVNQWLFDWLEKGYFAKLAFQGFIEGEKNGVFNIKKICLG